MRILAGIALLVPAAASAADAVRFVACPIYRNTDSGAKSGCWLADNPATGTRYDVSRSPTKPDWNHAILVEGRPSADTNDAVCGGRQLDPVRVSVLEQPCTRFMIAAEGFKGQRFALPKRNVRPLYEDRVRAARPFAERIMTVPFDFGGSFITYQLSDYYLDATINYALDVQPARIEVSGFAATRSTTVSNQTLSEPPSLARERAELVARALVMRGVPAARISVATGEDSAVGGEAFDGLEGPSRRRVEIKIVPEVAPAR